MRKSGLRAPRNNQRLQNAGSVGDIEVFVDWTVLGDYLDPCTGRMKFLLFDFVLTDNTMKTFTVYSRLISFLCSSSIPAPSACVFSSFAFSFSASSLAMSFFTSLTFPSSHYTYSNVAL